MGRQSNYEKSVYKQLEEVMARLENVENETGKTITKLNDKIDTLEKENSELKNKVKLLRDDNARLKSIINNDSSNTSNPPSSDKNKHKPVNKYNGREKSKRTTGAQKGHAGTTLTKKDIEKKLESGRFKHEIQEIGNPKNKKYITKYILDIDVTSVIKEVRIYADDNGKITIPSQYKSDVTYGSNIKTLCVALYSEGVMSNDRIASFINTASNDNIELSEGSVYNFCKVFANKANLSVSNLEENLLNQEVISTDATVVTVNGKQNYIRNFSTDKTVVYHAMKSKSLASLKEIKVLKDFTGTLVHDHETALYHFGTDHGECNVHLIRYLKKNSEETKNKWSDKMITLLCTINKERKNLISKGESSFTKNEITDYKKKYYELIEDGRNQNKITKHKYAKAEEKTLLNRLEKYSHNHLLCIYDFRVPFDDNISERDLRKVKNREKMAGGFRKYSGQEMYCTIFSIIETLKRRKMGLIQYIKKIFQGKPAIF